MEETSNEKHQNVYAKKIDGSKIYIENAESGRKGYYCIGCGCEMQAKKGYTKRKHHFSHQPNDVNRNGKCTYSDESYRHLLAKETLERLKFVKVPSVEKHPPKGTNGDINLLRKSFFVYAHRVENELYFFEDENGDIKYSKNVKMNDDNIQILIKPDVTFFDEQNKPILLIELVATHKVDESKKWKIRRLMIDTIEITIPKDSPAEIEKTFSKTNRTKWIFNNEEANTAYISVPRNHPISISQADELQERFFEETFSCRASEIKNLIRGITKNLGSEQYRTIESNLRTELQRVKTNTERNRERLTKIQDELQREIDSQFRKEIETIDSRITNLREAEGKFREYEADIKAKYNTETSRISKEESEYRPKCQSELEELERRISSFGTSAKSVSERRVEINREERRLQSEETELGQLLIREAASIEDSSRRERERIQRIITQRSELPNKYSKLEEDIIKEFRDLEDGLRKQFLERTTQIFEGIRSGNISGNSIIAREYSNLLEARRISYDIADLQRSCSRTRKAIKSINDSTYKNWTE